MCEFFNCDITFCCYYTIYQFFKKYFCVGMLSYFKKVHVCAYKHF